MILAEHEALQWLKEGGLPAVPARTVASLDAARTEARRLGYPVVLKLSSTRHTHKTEIGGVLLNLKDEADLADAYGRLEALRAAKDPTAKILLEPMAPRGIECFVGVQHHPQFGPVISTGLGGVWLELFSDVAFRLIPARTGDFLEMVRELQCWAKLEKGFRDLPALDPHRVARLLNDVADFVLQRPTIQELDLNPVIFTARESVVVDATIVVADDPAAQAESAP